MKDGGEAARNWGKVFHQIGYQGKVHCIIAGVCVSCHLGKNQLTDGGYRFIESYKLGYREEKTQRPRTQPMGKEEIRREIQKNILKPTKMETQHIRTYRIQQNSSMGEIYDDK